MTTTRITYAVYLALIVVTGFGALLLGLSLVQTLVVIPALIAGYLRSRIDSHRTAASSPRSSRERAATYIPAEPVVGGPRVHHSHAAPFAATTAAPPAIVDEIEAGGEDDLEDFMAGNH